MVTIAHDAEHTYTGADRPTESRSHRAGPAACPVHSNRARAVQPHCTPTDTTLQAGQPASSPPAAMMIAPQPGHGCFVCGGAVVAVGPRNP
jgi:hypothetical protein